MRLFYIDESGTGLKDVRSSYFVLAAVMLAEAHWRSVDEQLIGVKRGMIRWAKPEDFEVKGRDMRRGEKFFSTMGWPGRVEAMWKVAQLIAQLPYPISAVLVDKRELPEYISSDDHLYRLAFVRLLDALSDTLEDSGERGMVLLDACSDLHSSVQDRRLIDAYRDWFASRSGETALVELPWFGFSAFYAGLQLADFAAYLVDSDANNRDRGRHGTEMQRLFATFSRKVQILTIPRTAMAPAINARATTHRQARSIATPL